MSVLGQNALHDKQSTKTLFILREQREIRWGRSTKSGRGKRRGDRGPGPGVKGVSLSWEFGFTPWTSGDKRDFSTRESHTAERYQYVSRL